MHRLKTLIFLAGAALIVCGVHFLQYQAQLRQDRLDRLHLHIEDLTESYETQISELNQLYNETTRELLRTQDANQELNLELDEALQRIDSVEKRNRYLEQLLFNQQQTYRTAVAMNGSTMRVWSISSFNEKQYERAWIRLGAHGLRGIGPALVRAEEIYGVNSLVLAAIAYHESGAGTSRIARDKNNLFGLGAYDHNPYLYAFTFPTKNDSVYYAANLLSASYLSRWGRNYRGDNLVAVGQRYATDPFWAVKVGRCMALIARAAMPEGRWPYA
jgi:beta-N-acetylglucosaminidase